MNNSKVITAEHAASLIQDEWVVVIEGAGRLLLPETVSAAIERRFQKTGRPQNLTLIQTCGMGDDGHAGVGHFAHPGLIRRVISPGWGDAPRMAQLAAENKIEAYCFPQGIVCQMVWASASHKPRVISHVGLDTFVDPRQEGGKINTAAHEDLVEVIEIDGRPWLAYKVFPFNAAIIRGTTADEFGNISLEHEPVILETLAMAQAAKNSGGIVIAETKRLVKRGSLHPQMVKVPGMLVDYIVLNPEAQQIHGVPHYNPACSGGIRTPYPKKDKIELNARMIVARRAALELTPHSIINIGFGISDGIPEVALKEDIIEQITITVEQGSIGGVPLRGRALAAQVNPEVIIDQISQFNFYQGGGLDLAFLSFAQVDQFGNVNVSKFGSKINGCGGFIDISENAKKVVFSAMFSRANDVEIHNGQVKVLKKGRFSKFPRHVEQITFNGPKAFDRKQSVLYVTERAIFSLVEEGIKLIEIAPGCDVKNDILDHMAFSPIIPDRVKAMEKRFFNRLTWPSSKPGIESYHRKMSKDPETHQISSWPSRGEAMNNDLRELKSRLKLPPVSQIGVIVKDMSATVEYYSRQFGIGPFNVYESSPDHYWFKSKPSYVKLRQGKAMLGDLELELIQPLEGESPYHEFLENEGEGLNHLGFNIPNYDEMYESFVNAGIKQLMRVESYVKNYDGYIKACNFDTRHVGGVVIEIIWKSWLM